LGGDYKKEREDRVIHPSRGLRGPYGFEKGWISGEIKAKRDQTREIQKREDDGDRSNLNLNTNEGGAIEI